MRSSPVDQPEQTCDHGEPHQHPFAIRAPEIENEKAIATCQQGLTHHPNSVSGRVLWGKALINAGKAADAMKQFDLAVNIDKDNPHAYNLIGEALLRKGLYRSALPILRRAAGLQPNNARVQEWLEKTKQALAGGPAPVLGDAPLTTEQPAFVPKQAPRAAAPAPAAAPDPFAAFAPAKTDPDTQPTVLMSVPGSTPAAERDESNTQELPLVGATIDPPDPFASFGAGEPETMHGLTSTFDALGAGASAPRPAAATAARPPMASPPVVNT